MKKKPKIKAIIPARAGSKGIKNKNIIDIGGIPLIGKAIVTALASNVDEVLVSSNGRDILEIAERYGAKGIARSEKLATKTATSESALLDVINREKFDDSDIVVFLQATSPLLKKEDINIALAKFITNKYTTLFSATQASDMLFWDTNRMKPINYSPKSRLPRQLHKNNIIIETGAFYIFRAGWFRKKKCRIGGKIGYHLMDYWDSFQVDVTKDLKHIKKLLHR